MTSKTLDLEALDRILDTAGEETLTRVVAALEQMGSPAVPESVLARFRERLEAARALDRLNLEHLLAMPVHGIVVPDAQWRTGMTRIARSHLERLQAMVLEDLDDVRSGELIARCRERSLDDMAAVLDLGDSFWPEAAVLLEKRIATLGPRAEAGLKQSARLMARLLHVGSCMVVAQSHIPARPVIEIGRDALPAVAELLDEAAARGRDTLYLVLEVLIHLTQAPMAILEPVLSAGFAGNERERQTIAAVLVDGHIAQTLAKLEELAAGAPPPLPELAEEILEIVMTIDSLAEASTRIRFDQRAFSALRKKAVAFVSEETEARLEMRTMPAIVAAAEAEDVARAFASLEEDLRALTLIREAAKRIGLATRLDYAFDKLKDKVAAHVEGWVAARREAGQLKIVDLMDHIRLIEILFGSREAMAMFERHRSRCTGLMSMPFTASRPRTLARLLA